MSHFIRNVWKFLVFWGLALLAVIFISRHFNKEADIFYGIADTREILVNAENSVEILKINVVEGQEVDKNTCLVELTRPELSLKINQIAHQLEEIKATG